MGNTPIRTIRVPDEDWDAAMRKAKAQNKDLSTVIRRLLRQYARS
jgi:hypothetical protein